MDTPNSLIANRILKIRQHKDITQCTVSQALHLSNSAYSRLEAGETEITVNKLYAIAEALGEEVSMIMGVSPGSVTYNGDNNSCMIVAQYNQGAIHFTLDSETFERLKKEK